MKKKIKKAIYTILELVLIGVIAYNLYNIGDYFYGRYKAQKNFDKTHAIYEEVIEQELNKKFGSGELSEAEKRALEELQAKELMKKLREINKDVYAYIKIEGTTIDYPVVYKDNAYYLRRGIDRQYSLPGMIFIEETNKPDFSDRNTTIYGHRMSGASKKLAPMFGDLKELIDKDFVDSLPDKVVKIYTEEGVSRYRIFSGYHVDAYDDYRSFDMGDEEWINYLNKFTKSSALDFNLGRELKADDKIITLSTCDHLEHPDDDGRFAIHAVLENK